MSVFVRPHKNEKEMKKNSTHVDNIIIMERLVTAYFVFLRFNFATASAW